MEIFFSTKDCVVYLCNHFLSSVSRAALRMCNKLLHEMIPPFPIMIARERQETSLEVFVSLLSRYGLSYSILGVVHHYMELALYHGWSDNDPSDRVKFFFEDHRFSSYFTDDIQVKCIEIDASASFSRFFGNGEFDMFRFSEYFWNSVTFGKGVAFLEWLKAFMHGQRFKITADAMKKKTRDWNYKWKVEEAHTHKYHDPGTCTSSLFKQKMEFLIHWLGYDFVDTLVLFLLEIDCEHTAGCLLSMYGWMPSRTEDALEKHPRKWKYIRREVRDYLAKKRGGAGTESVAKKRKTKK